MPRLSSLIRPVISLACTLCTLLLDVSRFLGLCLRPSPALAAEQRSCISRHGTPARATQIDTVVVHPAGAVRDGWTRPSPHARCVCHLHQGGTLAVLWLRAA
jgi:hypothetical protein